MNGKTFYFLLTIVLGSHYRNASTQMTNQFRSVNQRHANSENANSRLSSTFESSDSSEDDRARWWQKFSSANILNAVLKQLQLNHRVDPSKEDYTYRKYLPDSSMDYPEYTGSNKDNIWEKEVRQIGKENHLPICQIERNVVALNNINNEYEYRPAYYDEVRCINPGYRHYSENEICSSFGFSCVQWNKTIHLTRRLFTSGCWEAETRVIPVACECMWPEHILGKQNLHT